MSVLQATGTIAFIGLRVNGQIYQLLLDNPITPLDGTNPPHTRGHGCRHRDHAT
jgi:hypothetical protein